MVSFERKEPWNGRVVASQTTWKIAEILEAVSVQVALVSGSRLVAAGLVAVGWVIDGIVMILIVCWITGINPLTLLSEEGMEVPNTQQETAGGTPRNDETTAFVRTVLAESEDTWNTVFKVNGAEYQEPALVLFSGQVQSACGFA